MRVQLRRVSIALAFGLLASALFDLLIAATGRGSWLAGLWLLPGIPASRALQQVLPTAAVAWFDVPDGPPAFLVLMPVSAFLVWTLVFALIWAVWDVRRHASRPAI